MYACFTCIPEEPSPANEQAAKRRSTFIVVIDETAAMETLPQSYESYEPDRASMDISAAGSSLPQATNGTFHLSMSKGQSHSNK